MRNFENFLFMQSEFFRINVYDKYIIQHYLLMEMIASHATNMIIIYKISELASVISQIL